MPYQGQSSDGIKPSELVKHIEEEDDIMTAIAASLETPQGVAREQNCWPSLDWSPKTSEDFMVYRRQKAAMAEAEEYSPWFRFIMFPSTVLLQAFSMISLLARNIATPSLN